MMEFCFGGNAGAPLPTLNSPRMSCTSRLVLAASLLLFSCRSPLSSVEVRSVLKPAPRILEIVFVCGVVGNKLVYVYILKMFP